MGAEWEMYLEGDVEGASVWIICTHPGCMRPGRTTPTNPEGLWLQDVGNLPFQPTAAQVTEAWDRHLIEKHDEETR